MMAVLGRELSGYFRTVSGYLFLAMYTLIAGIITVFINIGREMSASANLTLSAMTLPFLLIAPLLTMRLFAEERRTRTDQLVMTSPVRTGAIVTGKLLSAALMLFIGMVLVSLCFLFLGHWARISAVETLCVFIGYYLHGVSLLSIGLLISALCSGQMIAGLLTLGVNIFLYLNEQYIMPEIEGRTGSPAAAILQWLPSTERLGDFANGVMSLSDTVYFLGFTALMVFITVMTVEGRRFARRRGL